MANSKMFGSDYDRDDSAALSNATTDDEMFDRMMRVPLNLPTFLMPEKCKDESEAIEHMMHCLNRRYENFPTIFVGKLEEALRDAIKPQQIDQRSPLLIYVNNEKSVVTHFFFQQILSHAKTVDYLSENYLLWIWDVALSTNCKKLNEIFQRAFPSVEKQILFDNEDLEQYPVLIGVYRNAQGNFCYDRLVKDSQQDWKLDDFLNALRQFKDKFFQCERDLEQRRETIRKETELKTAALRRANMGRYHSIHPHSKNSKTYRSHIPHDRSYVLTDPIIRVEAEEFPDEFELRMRQIHRFERIEMSSDEADDEEDDPEQTPTIECPAPVFLRKKNPSK